MGNKADNIINSFNLSAVDEQKYDVVMETFENFIEK